MTVFSIRIEHCYQTTFEDRKLELGGTGKSFGITEQFPFELLQYTIGSAKLIEMKKNIGNKEMLLQDEFLIAYLASDLKTGVAQEIEHLKKCGIIEVDDMGFVKLADSWDKRVPAFMLYDMMEEGWGEEVDVQNRFCLHEDIRHSLSNNWKVTEEGWVRHYDHTDKILYYHDVYSESKKSFQEKWADGENEMEGIAQFGI